MPTVLIIGASRGIGLEFVRQYLIEGWEVHATLRTPDSHLPLKGVSGNLHLHRLDVRYSDQIRNLANTFLNHPIDVLIHNAGVSKSSGGAKEIMKINSEAPIELATALLDAVAQSAQKKIVLMTSQMGARGGSTAKLDPYGESKAQLNDHFRSLVSAWSEKKIRAIVMHPGWVRTDMGGPSAPLSVEESVRGMMDVIRNLSLQQHGSFLTWRGDTHPW
ncbi:SDR family oxidoreductase [bacterium]|nr:SDR family oxidoreductase [bacterium]